MDRHPQTRFVGDYILGPRIGSGSFAVVWLSSHRNSGAQVAVKEIDKKLLSPKVSENLLKEISILSTIHHPNIIHLFESIESEDRIFLVLEYCDGGDLAAYINRRGKVSEAVARHFMRQLAAGLQVLQENHLIHRDLKPQNLLLSSNEEAPCLKIGDFGFARSLTPQDLADTLCGSPLYMAPEIIQNQKYDAKADLWSVGAILFQLVTGKPPFDGNSQYQLFQNILTSTELQFPQGALEELHPDCVDLCRSLLRQNPVERLTFKEFFNHKFLGEPRLEVDAEQSSLVQEVKSAAEHFDSPVSDKGSQLCSEHLMHSASRSTKMYGSSLHDDVMQGLVHISTSETKSVHSSLPNFAHDKTRKAMDGSQCSSYNPKVADSVESIERDYVLVNCHSASIENFSCYSDKSLQGNSTTKVFFCSPNKNNQVVPVTPETKQHAATSVHGAENPLIHGSDPFSASHSSTISTVVQGQSRLTPSAKLRLLNRYAQAVAELAQEKKNAGSYLESFSVQLVCLAIWKKALQICESGLASSGDGDLSESSSANESNPAHGSKTNKTDLGGPSSACKWAEEGFVAAYDHAEKLSYHVHEMDADAEMPDAMEIIYREALVFGTSGAVDEYMGNRAGAAISYSKALLLLSFVVEEAASLPLNPPFLLTPANKKRIRNYIMNLQSHQSHF